MSCNSEDITVTLTTFGEEFNGLIYPKGLSKNSTCMTEYKQTDGLDVKYLLPLRSCNTMNVEVVNLSYKFLLLLLLLLFLLCFFVIIVEVFCLFVCF